MATSFGGESEQRYGRRRQLLYSQHATARPEASDFRLGDREIRSLEQNPATKSRWRPWPEPVKKVMQFLERGQYIAVDGKLHSHRKNKT
jgi:hypothetical protein